MFISRTRQLCMSALTLLTLASSHMASAQSIPTQEWLTTSQMAGMSMRERQNSLGFLPMGQIDIGYYWQNDGLLVQEGGERRQMDVNADLRVKRNATVVWGRMGFRNGRTSDVVMNETSDMWNVYPYLTIDTVGCDIRGQRYAFMGGMAYRKDNWVWGGEIDYRASIDRREVEGHPRNRTHDIEVSLGVGYDIGGMVVDAAIDTRIYRQRDEIGMISADGMDVVSHYMGLGNTYARYYGDATEASYSGGGVCSMLGIHESQGLYANRARLGGYHFEVEKSLDVVNDLPIARFDDNGIIADAQWCWMVWRWTADVRLSRRRGSEVVYDRADASDRYFEVGRTKPYDLKSIGLTLGGEMQSGWHDRLGCQIGYHAFNESHATAAEKMKMSAVDIKVSALKRLWNMLMFEADVMGRLPFAESLELTNDNDVAMMVRDNYNNCRQRMLRMGLKGRVDVWRCFVVADYHRAFFSNKKEIGQLELRIGYEL